MIPIKYNKLRYWLGLASVIGNDDSFRVTHLWGFSMLNCKSWDDYWWFSDEYWHHATFQSKDEAFKRLEIYISKPKKYKAV